MGKKPDELDTDLRRDLQKAADDNDALLMSYIAPDNIVRKSPVSFSYASIKVQDLYKIETEIESLKEQHRLPEKLHLIVQTPGGELSTSIKIAKYLQTVFGSNIEAYVPYEAASGGTFLCLAANEIVMDAASNLTPIDPQLYYKGERVSATSYEQAINEFKKENGNLRPEEIPSPFQQMGTQFDPILAKEMNRIAKDTLYVAANIQIKSQKATKQHDRSRAFNVAWTLVNSDWPHSHVISADEAKETIQMNVVQSDEKLSLLKLYKKWVSARLSAESDSHIIEWYCPSIKKYETKQTETTKKAE